MITGCECVCSITNKPMHTKNKHIHLSFTPFFPFSLRSILCHFFRCAIYTEMHMLYGVCAHIHHHHDPLPKPTHTFHEKQKCFFDVLLSGYLVCPFCTEAQSTTQNKHLHLFKFIYIFFMLCVVVFLFFSSSFVFASSFVYMTFQFSVQDRTRQRHRGDGHRIEADKLRRRNDHESIACALCATVYILN